MHGGSKAPDALLLKSAVGSIVITARSSDIVADLFVSRKHRKPVIQGATAQKLEYNMRKTQS